MATYSSGQQGTTGREPFEDSTFTPGAGAGQGAYEGGLGSAGVVGEGGGHHHHHGHHGHKHHEGGGGGEVYGANRGTEYSASGIDASGTGYGDNTGATGQTQTGRGHTDLVGNRNEDAALYEGKSQGGPVTSGAAGTDRFDTDKPRHGVSDVADRGYEGEPGAPAQRNSSAKEAVQSAFTTSDKEFTNRPPGAALDAYRDDAGRFQNNTSGPDGNTALTGREGTTEKNPVAQAKGAAAQGDSNADDGTEKKGFVQKVKDLL